MSQIILSKLKLISLLRTGRLGYCHLQVKEYLSSDSLLASPSRILEHSKKEGGWETSTLRLPRGKIWMLDIWEDHPKYMNQLSQFYELRNLSLCSFALLQIEYMPPQPRLIGAQLSKSFSNAKPMLKYVFQKKIHKLYFIKITTTTKTFMHQRTLSAEWKGNRKNERNPIYGKQLIPRTYKKLLQLNNINNHPI